jgi:hypothetical protein
MMAIILRPGRAGQVGYGQWPVAQAAQQAAVLNQS